MNPDDFRKPRIEILCQLIKASFAFESFIEFLGNEDAKIVGDRFYFYMEELGCYICADLANQEVYTMFKMSDADLATFPLATTLELTIFVQKMSIIITYLGTKNDLLWAATRVLSTSEEIYMIGNRGFVSDGCLFWQQINTDTYIRINPQEKTILRFIDPSDETWQGVTLPFEDLALLKVQIFEHFVYAYLKKAAELEAFRSYISSLSRHRISEAFSLN